MRFRIPTMCVVTSLLVAVSCSSDSVATPTVPVATSDPADLEAGLGPCQDECADGFSVSGKDYTLTCGQLARGLEGDSSYEVARGDVAWSDEEIQIRAIESEGGDLTYLAVLIDPDICQDDQGDPAWYVAVQGEVEDRLRFCSLLANEPSCG